MANPAYVCETTETMRSYGCLYFFFGICFGRFIPTTIPNTNFDKLFCFLFLVLFFDLCRTLLLNIYTSVCRRCESLCVYRNSCVPRMARAQWILHLRLIVLSHVGARMDLESPTFTRLSLNRTDLSYNDSHKNELVQITARFKYLRTCVLSVVSFYK